jgi:hypothetical protein
MWHNYRILQIEIQLGIVKVVREVRLEVPVKVFIFNNGIILVAEIRLDCRLRTNQLRRYHRRI